MTVTHSFFGHLLPLVLALVVVSKLISPLHALVNVVKEHEVCHVILTLYIHILRQL